MSNPENVCDACYQVQTLDGQPNAILRGVYCSHSRTGAFRIEAGGNVTEWCLYKGVEPKDFSGILATCGKIMRGEVSEADFRKALLEYQRRVNAKLPVHPYT